MFKVIYASSKLQHGPLSAQADKLPCHLPMPPLCSKHSMNEPLGYTEWMSLMPLYIAYHREWIITRLWLDTP